MNWKVYFNDHKGVGVLATADGNGQVNAAIYSRPHCFEDGTFAFIMRDRLTHTNISENPSATFLFKEESDTYAGHRFYLTRTRETNDPKTIAELQRRKYRSDPKEPRFLVYFSVDQVLPLIGEGDSTNADT